MPKESQKKGSFFVEYLCVVLIIVAPSHRVLDFFAWSTFPLLLMWILDIVVDGETRRYFLIAGTYTIGRKEECSICVAPLSSGGAEANNSNGSDSMLSVSRTHATLNVMHVMAQYSTVMDHVPEVLLSDQSKHGTFVNNCRIEAHEVHRKISSGDVLRFGQKVKAFISYSPIVVGMSPSLSSFEQREVHSMVCRIGGILVDPMPQEELYSASIPVLGFMFCTEQVNGELPSLFAMLYGYTLVTPAYLTLLADILRGSPALSMKRWPQPRAFDAMRSRHLADRVYFRPEPSFYEGEQFCASAPRSSNHIFRTCKFIVLDNELVRKYQSIVAAGGGKVFQCTLQSALEWCRREVAGIAGPPLAGFLATHADAEGFGTFVLISSVHFEIISHSLTAGDVADRDELRRRGDILCAYFQLWECGLSLVDVENIHAALYTNDPSSQLQALSPGVLSKRAMDALPEEDDADSNATEEGIAPYSGTSSRAAPPLALATGDHHSNSRIVVCAPEQLACSRATRRHAESDSAATTAGTVAPVVLPADVPRCASATGLMQEWQALKRDAQGGQTSAKLHWSGGATRVPPPQPSIRPLASNITPTNAHAAAPSSHPSVVSPPRTRYVSPTRSSGQAVGVSTLQALHVTSPLRRYSSPLSRINRPSPRSDDHLFTTCQAFERGPLHQISQQVHQTCQSIMEKGYIDGPAQSILNSSDKTIGEFLSGLHEAECAISHSVLSVDTRRLAHSIREKIDTIQKAIRATYRTIGIPNPNLSSPKKLHTASPTRRATTSPVRVAHSPSRKASTSNTEGNRK